MEAKAGRDTGSARFTDQARRALLYAHEEAVRLHHQALGTKHVLIGLIRVQESAAGQLLYRLGLELEPTRAMEDRLAHVDEQAAPVQPELAPTTKELLEKAVKEAGRAGHDRLSTGHLLLAMASMEQSVAIDTLRHFGITPERVQSYRQELLEGG